MRSRRPIISALFVLLSSLLFAAPPAQGQAKPGGVGPTGTVLKVSVGWGGLTQPDRWNPVYITLSDNTTRTIVLECSAPHGSFYGMTSRQVITIGPEEQTFVVYLPLRQFSPDDITFIVRDPATRRRLADYPAGPYLSFAPVEATPPGVSFLGISGRRATLKPITDALPGARLIAAHIEQDELPINPTGYDCLDVLVLNAPNLAALSIEQQQAIADWVRTGGNLLMWPGDMPVPDSGPLIDVLPCRIGNSAVIQLKPEELKSAGLSQRFRELAARTLSPRADAEPVTLLGVERVTAYQGRLGLGRIMVCPVDLASFQFANTRSTWALWRVVLKGMIRRLPEDAITAPDQAAYGGTGEAQQRELTAQRLVGDMLGTVPGAGSFGFGYVAGVLIAMMVVVGPVDWFVLKKLGRQPWTWATTTGWVALVTLSAVYAGHIFKSGELHWRTFELVDQVDGVAVARTDLAGLYSPRTTRYEVEARSDSWWQPTSPGDEFYGYRRSAQEITFAQTYRGSTPDPMVVNVWNLRFLKGESFAPTPGLLDAKLRVEQRQVEGKPKKFLAGTITNNTPEPLLHLAVRTQAGWARPFARPESTATQPATQPTEPLRIAPGQMVEINEPLDAMPAVAPPTQGNDWRRARYPYYSDQVAKIDRNRLWDQGGDLSMRRTDRIDQWLTDRSDLACVYAECENPPPAIELKNQQPLESHWKVVRALVPLEK